MPIWISETTHLRLKVELTLQHVQTDPPQLVNVWVVDFGEKTDLGWSHGVIFWKEQFELENPPCSMLGSSQTMRTMQVVPSYGDCEGPCMLTSKYLRLSS